MAETQGGSTMVTYIFESVQVLVPLTADLALVRLLLLHAECARVWRRCLRVDDGEGAVAVLVQLLRLVTVRLVVSGRMEVRRGSESGRNERILTSDHFGSYTPFRIQ